MGNTILVLLSLIFRLMFSRLSIQNTHYFVCHLYVAHPGGWSIKQCFERDSKVTQETKVLFLYIFKIICKQSWLVGWFEESGICRTFGMVLYFLSFV